MTTTEYVYLIWQEGTSFYKIGKANSPDKRLKDLQTGHSARLHLLAKMQCSEALRKEKYLHAKYSELRYGGEWFNIPPTMLQELFSDFRCHVEATPDTPVYYWATVAEEWKTAAEELRSVLRQTTERINAVNDQATNFLYISKVIGCIDEKLIGSLLDLNSDTAVEAYSSRFMETLEAYLLADQVEILSGYPKIMSDALESKGFVKLRMLKRELANARHVDFQ